MVRLQSYILSHPDNIHNHHLAIQNCNLCTKETQCDPFSKFFFGVCCKDCYKSLLIAYTAWIEDNKLEKTESNLNMFLGMIKSQVCHEKD